MQSEEKGTCGPTEVFDLATVPEVFSSTQEALTYADENQLKLIWEGAPDFIRWMGKLTPDQFISSVVKKKRGRAVAAFFPLAVEEADWQRRYVENEPMRKRREARLARQLEKRPLLLPEKALKAVLESDVHPMVKRACEFYGTQEGGEYKLGSHIVHVSKGIGHGVDMLCNNRNGKLYNILMNYKGLRVTVRFLDEIQSTFGVGSGRGRNRTLTRLPTVWATCTRP